MNFSRVSISLVLARIGWLPLLALIGSGLAAVLHFQVLPAWQRETLASQRMLTQLRTEPVESPAARQLTTRYGEFRARLAREEDRGDLLKTLFKIATDAGLVLAQGDYRLQSDSECSCQQLQITLPVRGGYLQIRKFIDEVLNAIPALSLDEIYFRRENVKSAAVEARLRLTVYFSEGH